MTRATVYLIDDDEAFRKSTRWLLQSSGYAVDDFADGREFLSTLTHTVSEPGSACIVSDIRMPGMSGLELQQALNKTVGAPPLVLITGHGDVPLAVQAMRNGAADFLEKPFAPERISKAIDTALEDAARNATGNLKAREKVASLTRREREVLDLVIAGKPNKLIADALKISIKTVEMHRANMKAKLGTRTLPDLMQLVFDAGMTQTQVPSE